MENIYEEAANRVVQAQEAAREKAEKEEDEDDDEEEMDVDEEEEDDEPAIDVRRLRKFLMHLATI